MDQIDLVSLVLRDPTVAPSWPLARWDVLVRQARRTNLLGRLAVALDQRGLLASIPAGPREHIKAARILSDAYRQAVVREVNHVVDALSELRVEIVLLKGAGYVLADLRAAQGRIFSDIDILVPKAALDDVEAALVRRGWSTGHHDAYYERYYRRWMHELPPMQHVDRATYLDVHHGILPKTARLKPDSRKLLTSSVPVAGCDRLRVLAPADMVLHSVAHLFQNEDLSNGLRDITDLDSLVREFAGDPAFWPHLTSRAIELDLARPLFYGLRCAHNILATPIPEALICDGALGAPPRSVRLVMESLYLHALTPLNAAGADWLGSAARSLLYLRAHWLRMPPHLLAYHLARKAFPAKAPKTAEAA